MVPSGRGRKTPEVPKKEEGRGDKGGREENDQCQCGAVPSGSRTILVSVQNNMNTLYSEKVC